MEPVQTEISNEATLYRYCRRCGRKLRNPDTMKIGYGKRRSEIPMLA